MDAVLITHDHYDHLEVKTIKFLRNRDTRFIVPLPEDVRKGEFEDSMLACVNTMDFRLGETESWFSFDCKRVDIVSSLRYEPYFE